MKKLGESGKLPSFRMTIEKRISAADGLLAASRPEFGQEITNEDPLFSTQTEIAKKIQGKLRVRKSQKLNARDPNDRPPTHDKTDTEPDHGEDFSMRLADIWENNSEVASVLSAFGSTAPAEEVRARLLKEAGVVQCQAGGGASLEEVGVGRGRRLCQLVASERRCGEHEQLLSRLIEERMRKLTDVLRTR